MNWEFESNGDLSNVFLRELEKELEQNEFKQVAELLKLFPRINIIKVTEDIYYIPEGIDRDRVIETNKIVIILEEIAQGYIINQFKLKFNKK